MWQSFDLAATEVDGGVERASQPAQVVRGDDQRLALVTQGAHRVVDRLLRPGVHGVERLVQQQEVRLLGQGAGQQRTLLLTARQLADLLPGEVRQAQAVEGRIGDLAVAPPRPGEPAEVDVAARQHQPLDADREAPVDLAALGQIRDPVVARADGVAVDADAPRGDRQQPGHRLQQRAFSRAVRADQGRASPARNTHAHAAKGGAVRAGVGHAQHIRQEGRSAVHRVGVPAARVREPGVVHGFRASTMVVTL